MNSIFTAKLLQNLRNKKANKGFTLIELLVVVIIIGVLAAVALPNLLSQVGKARESEAKTAVGSVNRAQQAFHFERQAFAPGGTDIEDASNALAVVVNPDFYSFAITANGNADAQVIASPEDGDNDGVRGYGGEITFATGNYNTILCQTNAVNTNITVANLDADADPTAATFVADACGADAGVIQ